MLKLSLLTTLLVGAWSVHGLSCPSRFPERAFDPSRFPERVLDNLFNSEFCIPRPKASGGGRWHSSTGGSGQFVSKLQTKACSLIPPKIGNYGTMQLRLTIDFDNGRREKFAWSVRNVPPAFGISEKEGSKHVFSSGGASVTISYNDKEQAVITIVGEEEEELELVLDDDGGRNFRNLPERDEQKKI